MDGREIDEHVSEITEKFLDKHFYHTALFTGKSVQRITDVALQVKGVDVKVTSSDNVIYIDEKVKFKGGYFNKLITFPAFELWRITKGGKYDVGWFIDDNVITDFYSFVTLYTKNTDPETLSESDIFKAVYLMFSKKELTENLDKNGLTKEQMLKNAIEICKSGEESRLTDVIEAGHKIYYKKSNQYKESPVNIIIHRDILRQLKSCREFSVSQNDVKWFRVKQ